jgi:hypothetical protein
MVVHLSILLAKQAGDMGPLGPVVKGVGWVVTAAAAILLTWRGRAKWEPAEEDVSQASTKVGGALCAVALGLLWFAFGRSAAHYKPLLWIAIAMAVLCLISLCLYSYLVAVSVYDRLVATGPGQSKSVKIIGGFRRTPQAKEIMRQDRTLTLKDVLLGAAYDPDRVWPRSSRAAAKIAFVLSYIALIFSGTIALAATAMLLAPSPS